jgi:hypothetical protein
LAADGYDLAADGYDLAADGYDLAANGDDLAADGYDLAADGYDNQVPGTRISGTRISHPDIKTRISEIAGLDAQDRPL